MGLLFIWYAPIAVKHPLPNPLILEYSPWNSLVSRPSKNPDGSCFAIDVVSGTTCQGISSTYDITQAEINTWNSKTWR